MLIVTEGEVTEVEYFEGLAQYLRFTGVLVGKARPRGLGKDPLRVVNEAIRQRKDPNNEYDHIWAVVDVDEHANLPSAIQLAKRSGIPLVVSNPCFEIWLLWHYVDCTSYQSKVDLERKLEKLGHTGKAIPLTFPHKDVGDAEDRSRAGHPGDLIKGENPSSTMADLLGAMRSG